MTRLWILAAASSALCLVISQPLLAEREPGVFSIAWDDVPGQIKDGSLFKVAEAYFSDSAKFPNRFSTDAERMLRTFDGSEVQNVEFDFNVLEAIHANCVGPFSHDEGRSWVQMSYICNTDNDTDLSKIVSFQSSPELTLTITFEQDLISALEAYEPVTVPGRRRYRMDAYHLMKDRTDG